MLPLPTVGRPLSPVPRIGADPKAPGRFELPSDSHQSCFTSAPKDGPALSTSLANEARFGLDALGTIQKKRLQPGGDPARTLVFRHNHLDSRASLFKIEHPQYGDPTATACAKIV